MSLETFTTKIKQNLCSPPEFHYPLDVCFSKHIHHWTDWLKNLKDKPGLRCLEIGSFEGRFAVWLLENILTHSSSRLYCIDPFDINYHPQMIDIHQRFKHNIKPYQSKVRLFQGISQETLVNNVHFVCPSFFDFIYIDGSHLACHVLEDAIHSFRLLKENGILIFDDYEWKLSEKYPNKNPKAAIDSFLMCFEGQYQLIHKGWQVCLVKKGSAWDNLD